MLLLTATLDGAARAGRFTRVGAAPCRRERPPERSSISGCKFAAHQQCTTPSVRRQLCATFLRMILAAAAQAAATRICLTSLCSCRACSAAVPQLKPVLNAGAKLPQVASTSWISPTAQVVGEVAVGDNCSVWYNCTVRGEDSIPHDGDGWAPCALGTGGRTCQAAESNASLLVQAFSCALTHGTIGTLHCPPFWQAMRSP